MRTRDVWTPALSCGAAGLVLAAGLAVRSVRRAIVLEPLPSAVRSSEQTGRSIPERAGGATPSRDVVTRAVAADPFRPDRRPPAEPFRMPGEALPSDSVVESLAPASAIQLIGTAVSDGGGFVMCQLGSDPPRLVRVGQSIGGFTLLSVGRGRAAFRDRAGQALDLRVPKAGT